MPIAAVFAEEAALALASELAPYAAGEAALAASTLLGTEALLGVGAEALGTGALGGAEALAASEAMAANAAAGGAGAGQAGINAAQVAAQQNAAVQAANAGITSVPQVQTFPVEGFQPDALSRSLVDPTMAVQPPMGLEGQIPGNQFIEPGSGGINSLQNTIAQANLSAPITPPSALEVGMDKAIKFAEKNPFTAMSAAYMGANALGLLNPSGATFNNAPYTGPLSRYKLADNFQGRVANPLDFQYKPKGYAVGGIMGAGDYDIPVGYAEGEMIEGDAPEYAKGGSLSDSISEYQKMLSGRPVEAPAASRDVGIYYDQDPDTRYQDALTAAQIRQAKVNQRAYVSPPAAKRPTPLGQLKMPTSGKSKGGDDVEAAQGGIMHSSLGGYAAGGNPRLLKGPGDGMSDNIPATINGRQPARLADGEFVIPADVVSHLGNGSTEAGAKQLHAMMNKVRKARTGNPKQGKEINPKKYMPK
jgi:hypothetical protein